MATLTRTEVTAAMVDLHIAKQELAALYEDLNTQAEKIMATANNKVQAIKDAQVKARTAAQEKVRVCELRLARGK